MHWIAADDDDHDVSNDNADDEDDKNDSDDFDDDAEDVADDDNEEEDAFNLDEVQLPLKKFTSSNLYARRVACILKSSKNTLEHLKLENIFLVEDDILEIGSTTLRLKKFEAINIPLSVAVKVIIATQVIHE